MTAQLAPVPIAKFWDNNGFPLALGTLTTYIAGTTTPLATYVDSTQTTQNTNPIQLNFRGECNLWLDPTKSYKFLLQDVFGNTVPGWPIDNITIGNANPSYNVIPTSDNLYTLGSPTFSWANIYVGANHAPILDTVSGNIGYYARTAAEIAAGVTPVNYAYSASNGVDVRRYMTALQLADVLAGTVTVDQSSAVNTAISVCAATTEWAPLIVPGRLLIATPASGGIATLGTIVAGSGYVNAVYTNVPLTGGSGSGAQATIVITGGVVALVCATTSGTGYLAGDTLSASAANLGGSGSGFSCKVFGLSGSLIINRLVGSTVSDFRIVGQGPGAGFYTTGGAVLFDSTIAYSNGGPGGIPAPVSEFVTFENMQFETSVVGNTSYVMSGKFLRVKYINCRIYKMGVVTSNTYGQTIHFINCNIRNCLNTVVSYTGSYDISFLHNIIEGNNCVFRSVDASIGTNSFRFIDNLMEGGQAISVQVTGVTGKISGNYFEAQQANDFNFFSGTLTNQAIEFTGNIILIPNGPTCYYGPTKTVMSGANVSNSGSAVSSSGVSIASGSGALTVTGGSFAAGDVGKVILVPGAGAGGATLIGVIASFTSATAVTISPTASTTLSGVAEQIQWGWPIHGNSAQVTQGVSIGDIVTAGAAVDAAIQQSINGANRFGAAAETWGGPQNFLNKGTNNNFGINFTPQSNVKLWIAGIDQTSANNAFAASDSAGNVIFGCRDDRQITAPALATATGTALVLDGTGFIKQQSSSRRYKKNEQPFVDGLELVLKLKPVTYELIEGNVPQVGFIAEDFPDSRFVNMAPVNPDDPSKGMQVQSVNYAHLTAVLARAVQELQAQVDQLKARDP